MKERIYDWKYIVLICTLISYLPQPVKLIKTKKSNDISILFWILWVLSSLSYALCALIVSNEYRLMFTIF